MKNLIILFAILFCLSTQQSFPQLKMEFNGGYIHTINHENVFSHIDGGAQGSIVVLYPLSQSVDLSGKFVYQSRSFDKNSFSFVIPLVAGYPIPNITDGDNLKSYGIMLGTRLTSKTNSLINTFLNAEAGLIYHSDSYYELNEISKIKYSDSKILFEYAVGLGFKVNLSNNYALIFDGKLAHIPSESNFYFPINLGFQLLL
ncbi:hypothetical protein [Ignavibacterium sp.]|uniref:hypothetical protein n=1 Tax=Ignavibacterium sp. TaxID=2651167 RepID=UPI00307EE63A